MAKLDVGVGDEFPTEENRREVHHYHHYYYRRRPGRFLRILLSIALVVLVFRLIDRFTDFAWWNMPMRGMSPFAYYYPFGSSLSLIIVLGLVLWFLRGRPGDEDQG